MRERFDTLSYFMGNDCPELSEFQPKDRSDFQLIRDAYLIDGERPPFRIRPATDQELQTLSGDAWTFVEDWLHIPSQRLIHVAYQFHHGYYDPSVFLGTRKHMVFALEDYWDGETVVVIAPKEQWDEALKNQNRHAWWGHGLFTDTYTDFFLWGIYRLPMHYKLRSRCDYETPLTSEEVKKELTSLGYEFVGTITNDGDDFVFADGADPVGYLDFLLNPR